MVAPMARIVKRGSGIQIRAYSGVDPATGKADRVVRSVPADTKPRELDRLVREVQAEADALAARRRERRRNPAARGASAPAADGVRPEDVTFRIAGEAWYRSHVQELEASGQAVPRMHLDRLLYPRIGDVCLWRFRPTLDREVEHDPDLVSMTEVFAELLATGGRQGGPLKVSYVKRTRGIARQVFEYALAKGWGTLTGNPVIGAKLPKEKSRPSTTPRQDDAGAFFARLAEDLPTLYAFGLVIASGPRPNEVYAMRWENIDLDTGTAKVGEEGAVRITEADETGRMVERFVVVSGGDTDKRHWRTVTFDEVTVEALRAHRRLAVENALACGVTLPDDAFVFSPDPAGSTTFSARWATRAFAKAAVAARAEGFRLPTGIRLYDVRHFAITQALAAGHSVADVAQRFGNSPRTIYARYAHAIPGNDEKIAASMGALWKAKKAGEVVALDVGEAP
jgi:integrase